MPSPPADSHPLAPWLRARVAQVRAQTQRRLFPATIELVPLTSGSPAAPVMSWEYAGHDCDHALKVDVLLRLLDGHGAPADDTAASLLQPVRVPLALVRVRPGRHDITDDDLAWLAAGRVAADIAGVPIATAISVSRWGWRDLVTGAQKSWQRLRIAL